MSFHIRVISPVEVLNYAGPTGAGSTIPPGTYELSEVPNPQNAKYPDEKPLAPAWVIEGTKTGQVLEAWQSNPQVEFL